jgi:hypothetical protein
LQGTLIFIYNTVIAYKSYSGVGRGRPSPLFWEERGGRHGQ